MGFSKNDLIAILKAMDDCGATIFNIDDSGLGFEFDLCIEQGTLLKRVGGIEFKDDGTVTVKKS